MMDQEWPVIVSGALRFKMCEHLAVLLIYFRHCLPAMCGLQ